ncbi:MAG TPA: hypothetical protein VFN79_10915 [Steroidobacteraceae bacterium]|nr:hypothetical protein [Steroidobacteraceae bacterium]
MPASLRHLWLGEQQLLVAAIHIPIRDVLRNPDTLLPAKDTRKAG